MIFFTSMYTPNGWSSYFVDAMEDPIGKSFGVLLFQKESNLRNLVLGLVVSDGRRPLTALDTARSGPDDGAMKNKNKFSNFSFFLLKSVLAAFLIMFACMAIGELFYDKNLFSGFLSRPKLWAGIFYETCVATILMTTIGAPILYLFRDKAKKPFLGIAATVWLLLDVVLISAHSYFYWTRDWHITKIAPGLIFGWILPGALFTIYLVYLSLDLKEAN